MQENETISSAVCPQCGAPLKIVDDKGTMKCEFCDTVSLDERHSFTHVSRDFESELEYMLESAETHLKNEYYDDAFNAYWNLTGTFGKDYRVWQGLAASITKNFKDYEVSDDCFMQVEKYYNTARSTKSFSESCEFTLVYNKWRNEVIARNKRIQAYAEKIARQERIKNTVFFASIPVFLFIYWFICCGIIMAFHPDYNPSADTGTTMFYMAIAPGIYSTALGIAAIITRFPFSSVCLSIMTIGCVCIFFAALGSLTSAFNPFNLFWFIGTAIMMLVIYTISTIIGRFLGYIAAGRSL